MCVYEFSPLESRSENRRFIRRIWLLRHTSGTRAQSSQSSLFPFGGELRSSSHSFRRPILLGATLSHSHLERQLPFVLSHPSFGFMLPCSFTWPLYGLMSKATHSGNPLLDPRPVFRDSPKTGFLKYICK